ncbi:MAG: hypothetical protein AB1642_10325 [Pseudomonadota bacterium]
MKALIGMIAIAVFLWATGGAQKAAAFFKLLDGESTVAAARQKAAEHEALFESTYTTPNGCAYPKTELRKLECKNMKDEARRYFMARVEASNSQR